MTINRVSFGQVVDVRYKFRSEYKDLDKKRPRAAKFANYDFDYFTNELKNKGGLVKKSNLENTSTNSHNIFYLRDVNRLITGDSVLIYSALEKRHPKAAEQYADLSAKKVDVYLD